MKTTGKVTGIVSNLVTVEVDGPVSQNEICYITVGDTKLMSEVIKVNGKNAAVQVSRAPAVSRTETLWSLRTECLRQLSVQVCFLTAMTDSRTTSPQ